MITVTGASPISEAVSGTCNIASSSASSSAPDVQKQETLVEYVCRFCKGIMEDIGRMIAQLSEIIHRTEEDAPKNHGTNDGSEIEDEPQPRTQTTKMHHYLQIAKAAKGDRFRRKEK